MHLVIGQRNISNVKCCRWIDFQASNMNSRDSKVSQHKQTNKHMTKEVKNTQNQTVCSSYLNNFNSSFPEKKDKIRLFIL